MAGGEELRSLWRRFPTGVAVVTVDLEGERLGLTIGSLVSLSLEPALIGFAVNRTAALHELLRRAGEFVANLLAAGQENLAQHFARGVPPIAIWEGIPIREGEGPPRLEGALGWIDCRLAEEHAAADHTFFVVEVLEVEQGPPGIRPLLRLDQNYRDL